MFEKSELVVVTTEVNLEEVREYLPEFAHRYGLEEEILLEVLELLPVGVYSESDYITHINQARKVLAGRDDDDVALEALALKLKVPVWSNDDDFEDHPYGMFTTAKLIKVLGV